MAPNLSIVCSASQEAVAARAPCCATPKIVQTICFLLLSSPARSCWSAGLPQEAVAALQEAQLWRYAAGLTANTLTASDRAISLERWAAHIQQVAPA